MKLRMAGRALAARLRRAVAFRQPRFAADDAVMAIAERLTGRNRLSLVLQQTVLRQNRRVLVRLHRIGPVGADPLVRIIEKQTTAPQEYRFYGEASRAPGAEPPLPALHARADQGPFCRDPRRFVLLMEHVEQVGGVELSETNARQLGDAMSAITTLPLLGRGWSRRSNHLSRRLLARVTRLAGAAGQTDVNAPWRGHLAELTQDWDRISRLCTSGLLLVPCHNDLHPGNICRTPDGRGGARFVFIDWEAFGPNYAGADLHHMLRQAVEDAGFAGFHAELRHSYIERLSELHGVDVRTVDLGAHLYALRRSLRRAVLERSIAELKIALQIHQSLKAVEPPS